jgi:hypothetical protein
VNSALVHPFCRFKLTYAWHIDVEQNEMRVPSLDLMKGIMTIGCTAGVVPLSGQNCREQLHIFRHVINNQDAVFHHIAFRISDATNEVLDEGPASGLFT